MEEYPRTLAGFETWFGSEQACRDYLFRLRWPAGFRCPRCEGAHFWPVRSVLMQCQACGHQTSVTAGTIFQDTRKPLVDWFREVGITTLDGGRYSIGLLICSIGGYRDWAS